MLGYHDSSKCVFDLWAPNPKAWGDNAIENRAFSGFAKHTQEIEDIINEAVTRYAYGETNLTFDIDDDLSESDLEYIKSEIERKIGLF